jgi:hypothetical protein
LEVSYSAPAQMSGHAVLDVAHQVWPGQEDLAGHVCSLGFLFLYELITGTKHAKILNTDNSLSFATLLYEMYSDKSENTLLSSVISILCKFPSIIPLMPKFKDDRQYKKATIQGAPTDNDPVSPLGRLLTTCLQVIQTEISELLEEQPDWDESPPLQKKDISVNLLCTSRFKNPDNNMNDEITNSNVSTSIERNAMWIVPNISDFSCDNRLLKEIQPELNNDSITNNLDPLLSLSLQEIEEFSTLPLSSINLDNYITDISRIDNNLAPIDEVLPFNISGHNQANSKVAKNMLNRLSTDMKEYAVTQNEGFTSKLKFLLPIEMISKEGVDDIYLINNYVNEALVELDTLINSLADLRDRDNLYVETSIPWLLDRVNSVHEVDFNNNDSTESCNKSTDIADTSMNIDNEGNSNQCSSNDIANTENKYKILYILKRICKQESRIWLEFLFSSFLSSNQIEDLSILNPFLTKEDIDLISVRLLYNF